MNLVKVLFIAIILSFSGVNIALNKEQVILSPSHQTSGEGYFSLSWNNLMSNKISRDHLLFLELSSDEQFTQVHRKYALPNSHQIALSGFEDGEYFFRLANADNTVSSNVVTVLVKHRSLQSAGHLFLLGLTLFAFLLGTLFISRQSRQNTTSR